jgi:hypothetical protein
MAKNVKEIVKNLIFHVFCHNFFKTWSILILIIQDSICSVKKELKIDSKFTGIGSVFEKFE